MDSSQEKRLFLLDAYALIFRGYYAFIKNPRINSKGLNTSAIMSFTNSLLDILHREKPTHIAVVFDVGGGNLRSQEYPNYKAHREETPEAIRVAVPYIQEILNAFRIPVLYAEGYEADDVIGTLAQKAERHGYTTYMVTPDKDFAQLVTENIKIYKPSTRANEIEILGIEEVCERYGVQEPRQVIDLLSMMGDAVDNIPGLPGVGEKTAKKFIQEYGSLENLLAHIHELSGKMKERIEANRDLGVLSKKLATIITDAPVVWEEEKLLMEAPDLSKIQKLFQELEFIRLLENVYRLPPTYGGQVEMVGIKYPATKQKQRLGSQSSLFDTFPVNRGLSRAPTTYASIEDTDHLYQLIDTPKARQLLLEKLLEQKIVCFDTETTGLISLKAELVGLAFSWQNGKGYYVSFPENFQETQKILEIFKPFFEHPDIMKIGHNLKYDIKVLYKYNLSVDGPLYDTMIAHYLLRPDARHNMDVLSVNFLQYKPIPIEALIGKKGKGQLSMRNVDLNSQIEYAVEDADITLQLKRVFDPLLIQYNAEKLFREVEIPLMPVLAAMEIEGIHLDMGALEILSKQFEGDLALLEEKIYKMSGEVFNLNSPKQLGEVLFEKLKIIETAKKTKTGQYATSEDILIKLSHQHQIVQDILEYRQLQKLKSTYVDALPKQMDRHSGRVHTIFSQTITATGRLTSTDPNLQNIPIRSQRGREVRKAFIARDGDYVVLSADYSQIELRLIAELSEDPMMTTSFMRGEDIHDATASKIFGISLEAITREQRDQAKTVNFGIIYGVSAFGLSEQTSLSRAEAKKLIDTYYATYPVLKEYIARQIDFAHQHGFVETILGRRRYLPDIHSNNAVVRAHAERNAVNAPIQGSAADVIKIAMIRIDEAFREKKLRSKMLLQVHDELVFDVHKKELDLVSGLIRTKMEQAVETKIPLVVDIGVGKNWLEAH
ncbi:MAG: DNA polymerase I [Flavobacteriales bacterium AspAUS03]